MSGEVEAGIVVWCQEKGVWCGATPVMFKIKKRSSLSGVKQHVIKCTRTCPLSRWFLNTAFLPPTLRLFPSLK